MSDDAAVVPDQRLAVPGARLSVPSARRAVLVLALAQSTAMVSNSIVIVTSALTGQMLAVDKAWATAPLACQFIATMLTTFPASFLMKRIGRKRGFMIGAVVGIIGGITMFGAVLAGSFWLFALGNAIFGASAAFTLFYRFAAAEAADDAFRPKAISLVMAGGIAAALFGPELAKLGQDFFTPQLFAGGFAFVGALSFLVMLLLLPLRLPPVFGANTQAASLPARPLLEIVTQPRALSAIVAAMLGYGGMSFVMTATPLAMRFCGFELKTGIAFVIQVHVLAMYLPSFVTGHVIRRFGELHVMATGVACYCVCIAVGLSGTDIHHFWPALALLGLGWNFLYVAGTSQLTKCYRQAERAKVQAFNDCATFSGVALCSLIAGTVEQAFGWDWVLRGAILPVLLIGCAIIYGYAMEKRVAAT